MDYVRVYREDSYSCVHSENNTREQDDCYNPGDDSCCLQLHHG